MIARRAEAMLAGQVPTPTRHGVLSAQGARVEAARCDLDCVGQIRNDDRPSLADGCAVSELAFFVVAPAAHGSAPMKGAGVTIANGGLNDVVEASDTLRVASTLEGA